ncbi:uncharacterized protein LOC129771173 isoform X2 [Toxorhynchites rutilus septentrionalis]|uniref:uncharacterized protein LOC129771173 isoform X2 n=1 Tax=Toxorhynchites rutilus septentrionalis TaxID=329112 RepID=UPI00247A1D79|nr:uncharacterized protein LOC129771173 isoform X2 [Toxorhynchites rutilus septentrionalis]
MERGPVTSRIPSISKIPICSCANQETGVRMDKDRSSKKGVGNVGDQQMEKKHQIWFFNYSGWWMWIEEETSPQLVPSDIKVSYANFIDSNIERIEDITPPELVPSDAHLEDDDEDVFDWEPGNISEKLKIKAERNLLKIKAENEKLRQENQRLKAKKGLSLINQLCFRFMLFMQVDVCKTANPEERRMKQHN